MFTAKGGMPPCQFSGGTVTIWKIAQGLPRGKPSEFQAADDKRGVSLEFRLEAVYAWPGPAEAG